jgi:hypothetical protein
MAASTYLDQVQQLYIAYFGRPADTVGQAYWAAQIDAANGSIASVISGFSSSTESQALFSNLTSAQKVAAIYQNAFGRSPEPTGLAYWVAQLDAGSVSQAQASWTIQQSAGLGDAAAVANKLAAAKAFTAQLDTPAEVAGYTGAAAAVSARAFLTTVDATPGSLTAANAAAPNAVAAATVAVTAPTTPTTPTAPSAPSGGTPAPAVFSVSKDGSNIVSFQHAGTSVTEMTDLTGNVSSFTSGAPFVGNSSVTGTVAGVVVPTGTALTASSTFAADKTFSGPGTLVLSDTGAVTATVLKNIEASTTGLLDASSVPSITAANAADAVLLMVTNQGTTGNKIKTADYVHVTLAGTTVGSASTLKAIDDATTGTVDATSITTILSSTVAEATQLLVTGSAGQITFAGNVALTLSDTGAISGDTLKAIDDATTGLVNASSITSITGASIDAAKQLLVTDLATFTHNATVTVALADLAVSAADLNAIDGQTVGLVTAASLLNISGSVSETAASLSSGGLSMPVLNSVNLTDALTASAFSTATFTNNVTISLANVAGNTMTAVDGTVGAGKVLTIEGSALTTNSLIFNGAAETNGSFVLQGGQGNDTLTGGANADVFTGSGGNDKFFIKGGLTATTIDSITDFRSGIDTIYFSAAGTTPSSVNIAGAPVVDFAAALAAANLVLTNAGGSTDQLDQISIQQVGADSYAFYNDGFAAGADQIVKLNGVALSDVATTDFIPA